jgi:predicted TIM-barrel fold metal-dependent hydrolase
MPLLFRRRAGAAALAALLAATLPAPALADGAHIGEAVHELPLFDAHMHWKEPAWEAYPPATVIELMDRSGVAMALVSSTPDEGTIRLKEFAPARIVPELRPYHGSAGSSNWTKADGMFDYLMGRLEKHPEHTGFGEFHLHRVDPRDEDLLRGIAKVAVERGLFVHVHSGHEPVEMLFGFEPSLKIIWAHAGMSEPAEVVEDMMATYATLYADTSFRERDIIDAGATIAPAWRRVIERFPDRFMVGTDTWVNGQWAQYEQLIALNRQWLAQFSRPVAEAVAYKNAERLFGRTVERRLIGTR